jgi:uncharacterized membrane protein
MANHRAQSFALLRTVTKVCILTFVLWVGALIVASSSYYFPPQFEFGFLVGREPYFYSWYAVAFYSHVISAPFALLAGLAQSSDTLRRRFPTLHRGVGKFYVLVVLVFVAPSGLAMSTKALGGTSSMLGFASLSVATAASTWMGFTAARQGEFSRHQRWMTRSFILLCSAVLLRFLAAVANRFELDFLTYGAMAWLCWLPSLAVYEIAVRRKK